MSESREKTQADCDLERIIEVMDQAIMSEDPRVRECLRRLMVTVALIDPEGRGQKRSGPFQQMFEELRHISTRLSYLENEIQKTTQRHEKDWYLKQLEAGKQIPPSPTYQLPPVWNTTAGGAVPGDMLENWSSTSMLTDTSRGAINSGRNKP